MKTLILICMSFFSILTGCTRTKVVEGGLYCTPRDRGGYSVLKILKLDDNGVHVRLYSNTFMEPPKHIDESTLYMAGMNRKPGEELGMGHLPLSKKSFEGWKVTFIQQSTVTKEDLEGYNIWLEDNGGYF